MECPKCGVAFDVGRRYCVELGCGVPRAAVAMRTTIVAKKQKAVDPVYSRFVGARARSRKMGLPFDLTLDFIAATLLLPCTYCGQHEAPQLDRKDNGRGYTQDNIVPACKRCNTVKSMYLSHDQMIVVARALGWKTD